MVTAAIGRGLGMETIYASAKNKGDHFGNPIFPFPNPKDRQW
jgi:hypothetical protein